MTILIPLSIANPRFSRPRDNNRVPISQAAQRGAFDYLHKSIPPDDCQPPSKRRTTDCLDSVRRSCALIWQSFRNPPPATAERNKLSPGEAEVLDLLAQSYDRADLAQPLSIGKETVKAHLRNILSSPMPDPATSNPITRQ